MSKISPFSCHHETSVLEVCEILAEYEELVLPGRLVEFGLVHALVGVGVAVVSVLVEIRSLYNRCAKVLRFQCSHTHLLML